MTVDDLERAAKAISFCGGLALWKPRVEVRRGTMVRIQVSLLVPHRETGEMVPVVKEHYFEPAMVEFMTQEAAKAFLLKEVFGVAMHEVSEGIMYGSERPYEPHKPPAAPVSPLRF